MFSSAARRRRVKTSTALALGAVAGIAALALGMLASGRGKRVVKRAVAHWNLRQRSATKVVERPFAQLAASQVGYAPSMAKRSEERRVGKECRSRWAL